jgi:hypothetical protein
MIRTARILLAGLLHVLAAHIDVHDTYIVECWTTPMEPPPVWDGYMTGTFAQHDAEIVYRPSDN